ncbi:hypothetical protein TW95_gp1486 [Pandoravirus inopinatum]|uniref:Uncharacterized protein n=1 Tax=Pandoravirus inopinatum TaxID=1605721 RepID=A0A0B5J8I2_9VIRU|nr:hypothetical protein TW95_gp1486 [Pandoravirus inopinatum]AJF98220.1 hypothetical protein [Pandoravirus inopinatum]
MEPAQRHQRPQYEKKPFIKKQKRKAISVQAAAAARSTEPARSDGSHAVRLQFGTRNIDALHGVELLVFQHEHEFIEVDAGNALGVGGRQEGTGHACVHQRRVGVQKGDHRVLVLCGDDAALRGMTHKTAKSIDQRWRVAVAGVAALEATCNERQHGHEEDDGGGAHQCDLESRGALGGGHHGARRVVAAGDAGGPCRDASIGCDGNDGSSRRACKQRRPFFFPQATPMGQCGRIGHRRAASATPSTRLHHSTPPPLNKIVKKRERRH